MTREAQASPGVSWLSPSIGLALACALSVVVASAVHSAGEERTQARFSTLTAAVLARVEERMAGHQSLLRATRALYVSGGDVSRTTFHVYVRGLDVDGFEGLVGLGWAPIVPDKDRDAIIATARGENILGFRLWPESRVTELRTAVLYLEPLTAGNRQLLGFDMLTQPELREAMLRARDEGVPALSRPTPMSHQPGGAGETGFVLYLPVYASPDLPSTVELRRASLRGFVYASFRADRLFAGIFDGAPIGPLAFRVGDGDAGVTRPSPLFDSAVHWAVPVDDNLSEDRRLRVAGRDWMFRFRAAQGFATWDERASAPLLGAAGVLVGLLVFALTLRQVQARAVAERSATQLREQELERARLLDQEQAARRDAERALAELARRNRELDEFAYVASHDLKAPLRGIANIATWLAEDLGPALTGEPREHLAMLQGRVLRLERLIDGILSYARAGRVRTDRERVALEPLVREVFSLLEPPREAKLVVGPLPVLDTERAPMQQIFLNLIGNALKHSGRDDVTIGVTCDDAGPEWRISVADDGCGIAPEFHDKVFGLFQTLQPRDRVESTGIGLAVVRKIAESRGGRCWVEENAPQGAVFCFTVPKD